MQCACPDTMMQHHHLIQNITDEIRLHTIISFLSKSFLDWMCSWTLLRPNQNNQKTLISTPMSFRPRHRLWILTNLEAANFSRPVDNRIELFVGSQDSICNSCLLPQSHLDRQI